MKMKIVSKWVMFKFKFIFYENFILCWTINLHQLKNAYKLCYYFSAMRKAANSFYRATLC